tara:strand:- start:658 stop:1764 length:1107 start_codon:yes stop_codon:yes gene_type:complete
MPRVISIDGNIGSGKSTFIQYLKKYYSDKNNCGNLKICFLDEPVDLWNKIVDKDNKTMIECYYSDSEKYAFPFQMMAYISRLSSLKNALKSNYDLIFTERSVFTDKNVFCKMLYDDSQINEIEYKIYNTWFNEFLEDIPNIEYIYLKTDVQTSFDRIITRARIGENIQIEYLKRCHEYHENWLNSVLDKYVINSNIDINTNPEVVSKWIKDIDKYVQTFVVTFDGACRGNPGPCSLGYVIKKCDNILHQEGKFITKRNTNNYAEYCALIAALEKCNEIGIKNVIIKGDSNLVIKQMNKEYKVDSPNLLPLYNRAVELIMDLNFIQFIQISRNKNEEADRLANLALNKWGKKHYVEDDDISFHGELLLE